jgi:hypothetical protein
VIQREAGLGRASHAEDAHFDEKRSDTPKLMMKIVPKLIAHTRLLQYQFDLREDKPDSEFDMAAEGYHTG